MKMNKKLDGKKKEIVIYKPHIIIVKGKLADGKDMEIIFTPEDFKEWIFKMIEQGFDNVAIFAKEKK